MFKNEMEKRYYIHGLRGALPRVREMQAKYKEGSHLWDAFEVTINKLQKDIRALEDLKVTVNK